MAEFLPDLALRVVGDDVHVPSRVLQEAGMPQRHHDASADLRGGQHEGRVRRPGFLIDLPHMPGVLRRHAVRPAVLICVFGDMPPLLPVSHRPGQGLVPSVLPDQVPGFPVPDHLPESPYVAGGRRHLHQRRLDPFILGFCLVKNGILHRRQVQIHPGDDLRQRLPVREGLLNDPVPVSLQLLRQVQLSHQQQLHLGVLVHHPQERTFDHFKIRVMGQGSAEVADEHLPVPFCGVLLPLPPGRLAQLRHPLGGAVPVDPDLRHIFLHLFPQPGRGGGGPVAHPQGGSVTVHALVIQRPVFPVHPLHRGDLIRIFCVDDQIIHVEQHPLVHTLRQPDRRAQTAVARAGNDDLSHFFSLLLFSENHLNYFDKIFYSNYYFF